MFWLKLIFYIGLLGLLDWIFVEWLFRDREGTDAGGKANTTHGWTWLPRESYCTRTYRSWAAMKSRCLNENATCFENYGGRGVMIIEKWMVYENFLGDMGRRPAGKTLDRIDPNGNYEPSNCRWATPLVQRHNRRNA
jgi:hypothetical protein